MMLKAIPGIRTVEIPFNGGMNESSAVNTIPNNQALIMDNWRISKDGTRIEKRLGLNEEANNFAEDIYGYTTYYDNNNTFCQLAILESQMKRKVGNNNWASIHTWNNNTLLAHPVIPIELQGKLYIIWENDSRMIHYDGNDYQIGITAPSNLANVAASYATEDTLPMTDWMEYANTANMTTVWADEDTTNANSTHATSGPGSVGPDNNANNYMKLQVNVGAANTYAMRSRYLANEADPTPLGTSYTLTMPIYFDKVGVDSSNMAFHAKLWNGAFLTHLAFGSTGIYVDSDDGNKALRTTGVVEDKWKTYKFIVDGTEPEAPTIQGYINNISMGNAVAYNKADVTTDAIRLYAEGYHNWTSRPTVYVDSINIGTSSGLAGVLEGTYRYAITYARGGNYGYESNPIKSKIGSVTFTGSGNNDMSVGGDYTANESKTIRVQIDGTGTPNTVKWSDDDGETWRSKTLAISSNNMTLSYGVNIGFNSTTGHTANDYWSFPCQAMAVTAAKQTITLTNIPVSSDPQVTQRKIYRTARGGTTFMWLATINDNTTTTFVDNIPDSALGSEMEEDKDILSNGKFSVWWDNRLWVSGDNIIYYSDVDVPEQFDLDVRFIKLRSGLVGDRITGMLEYRDSLYVFKRRSTFVITANTDGTYSCSQTHKDFGFSAPWSMLEVQGLLMGYNDRGIDIFNGINNDVTFATQVERTVSTVDESKLDYICSCHNPTYNEVFQSFPDRTGGNAAKTVVYNYVSHAFYTFSFPKTISCLCECKDSSGNYVVKMGTRDGYLYLCDSGYLDGTTAITADLLKPWITLPEYGDIRKIELECEIPNDKSLTVEAYTNFEKDAKRVATIYGVTPDTTLQDYRKVLFGKIELGQRGKYVAFRLRNSETMTDHLRLNNMIVYLRSRSMKEGISGD